MVIDPNRKLRGRIKWLGREVDVDYGVDAIPTLFIIDGRDNVIYGDVSFDPSLEFVLAQELGLVDEAAPGA